MSSYEEIVVDRNINDAWKTFRTRLADHLLSEAFVTSVDLVPAESEAGVLIVEEPDGTLGLWAVVDKPGTGGSRRLRGLGFERDADGWYLGVERRYADRVAHAAYVVLHELLGAIHPSLTDVDPATLDLWDDLADETPAPIHLPNLAYPNDAEGLQRLVDATMEREFGHPPQKDDDGDIPVTNEEGGTAYVSARGDFAVEVWSVLAVDIDLRKASRAIGRLSTKYPLHKFEVRGRSLVASVPIFAHPFVPELLTSALGGTLFVSATERERQGRKLRRVERPRRSGPRGTPPSQQELPDVDAPNRSDPA